MWYVLNSGECAIIVTNVCAFYNVLFATVYVFKRNRCANLLAMTIN